jgi:hypothetical protein
VLLVDGEHQDLVVHQVPVDPVQHTQFVTVQLLCITLAEVVALPAQEAILAEVVPAEAEVEVVSEDQDLQVKITPVVVDAEILAAQAL